MGDLVEKVDVPYGFDEFRAIAEVLLTLESEIQVEMVKNISVANPSVTSKMLDNLENNTGEHTSTSFILTSLYSVDNHLRSKAALEVGRRCDQELFFERAMKNSDARVVANVIESLWGRRTDFATSFLKRGLDYPHNRVVVNAAVGLHKIGNPIGLNTLIGLLNNPEPAMRASAAWGLGEIRATGVGAKQRKRASPLLRLLQRDTDESVRLNATIALEKVTESAAKLARKPGELNAKINYVDASALPRLLLYISVKNAIGQPINNLTAENFIIAENDIVSEEQPRLVGNEDGRGEAKGTFFAPTSVAIVMDYSGSMMKSDIKAMESAARSFVSEMAPYDRGCIIKFSGDVDIVQEFTSDKKLLLNSIKKRYNSQSDGTALYDSMYAAVEELRREGDCIKSIVVITDGDDSSKRARGQGATNPLAPSPFSPSGLIQFAIDQSVSVYTIGLGSDSPTLECGDSSMLMQIATSTGGSYYPVDDTDWLVTIYQSISKTLKSHYVISYTTTQVGAKQRKRASPLLKVNVKYGNFTALDTVGL